MIAKPLIRESLGPSRAVAPQEKTKYFVIRVAILRKTKWVGRIAPMMETKNACENLICIPVNINIEEHLWIHLLNSTET
jgi:hypothetical protein